MNNIKYSIIISSLLLAGCSQVTLPRMADHSYKKTASVPILLYHHIHELPADASEALRRWSLTPEQFSEQIQWIQGQGFHVITMAQMNEHLNHGELLPAKPIILTFDDGWKDHYEVVFPILKKYHFAATFFITTESVGHSAFVTWEDLQEMSAAGMDIQAHSVTHPHLTRLKNEQAYREIADSKKALEGHLNKPVTVFAYPFGNYSEKIVGMVKKAGYESATIVSGSNIGYLYRSNRAYTLSRIAVEGGMSLDDVARDVEEMTEQYAAYQ